MTYLGSRSEIGAADPENLVGAGNWTVSFRDLYPADYEVFHAAVLGPGGSFRVYVDDQLYSASIRGDINEYDPKHAMYVRRGQTIRFYWSVSTGSAPKVWLYCRTPGETL